MNASRGASLRPAAPTLRRGWLALAVIAGLLAGTTASTRAAGTPGPARTVAAKPAATVAPPAAATRQVVAYYFYTTYRCASCRAIEAWSREAIEGAFAEQIRDGRLVWKPVNTDLEGNEHFVKDFKLYTKSLVLVDVVRGKRREWRNLEKVWQLLQDKPGFVRYVQDETRSFLAEHS